MHQFVRFGIFAMVGVVNTLFDLFVWKIIIQLWGGNSNFQKLAKQLKLNSQSLAHVFSFLAGTLLSYFLNSAITFQARNRSAGQIATFFLVSVFSLVLSTIFLKWLTTSDFGIALQKKLTLIEHRVLSKKGNLAVKNWDLICKGITIIISLLTNYLGYSLLVFV